MKTRDHECAFCRGAGEVGPVHVNKGQVNGECVGEWLDSMPCRECDGTGRWSGERAARFKAGLRMKAERLARQESFMEAGQRLGISPAEVSEIERGREPTTEAGRRALEKSHEAE